MYCERIKTGLTSYQIASLFKDRPYLFFLDSGMDPAKLGRYSFIGSDPFLIFKSKGKRITIFQQEEVVPLEGNPLDELRRLLKAYKTDEQVEIPFTGGAVGYFSYDLCHELEALPSTAVDDLELPDCYFCFYDSIIVIDHLEQATFLVTHGFSDRKKSVAKKIKRVIKVGEKKALYLQDTLNPALIHFKAAFTREDFISAVENVRAYIRSGDVYQINMTQRFDCSLSGDSWQLYGRLRELNPAPFSAYLNFHDVTVLSSSPERFLRIKEGMIETRPIKGTRPRGETPEEEAAFKKELSESEKDKAELLMIVDLERNDVGKVSRLGTVRVPELFHLETYPTLHHLVATVTGELQDGSDVIDCIRAMFPGGSITGAPKIRAMEIIDELEPTARNLYTGSLGYIGFNGNTDLNIVIRTIVARGGQAYMQTGSGIVWDSDPEQEYEETLLKIKALKQALQGELL